MDKELKAYLQSVDKCLKPMTTAERGDILREIESEILDLNQAGLTTQEILDRLGPPKALAKAYLQDLLTKNHDIRWNRILMTFAYCGLVGFSGLFVIPTLGILAPTLMICGVISPIAGLIKLGGHIIGREVPYIMFQFGSVTLSPWLAFPLSIIFGILMFFLGKGAWKLLLRYLQTASEVGKKI